MLHGQILDALSAQIAVIDAGGFICYVNQAWRNFARENGMAGDYRWEGSNYFVGCNSEESKDGQQAVTLIKEVLLGVRAEAYFEYPCHSPASRRWFMMQVTPIANTKFFVISHHNITDRKLIEEKIELLTLHDPLTGLGNRRLFLQESHRQWLHLQRYPACISVLMIDIDFFKIYNDHFGHLAGDQCLIAVAEVVQANAQRPDDVAIRFGGEEFLLLLGNTDAKAAIGVARKIQEGIIDLPLRTPTNNPITVSIGIASSCPRSHSEINRMVDLADKQLYLAKQSGRNCFKVHELGAICHTCPYRRTIVQH